MRQRLWLALAGTVVLAIVAMTGTTGALWSEEASVDAGTVRTGNLELLAGGEPENYLMTDLSSGNLAPGDAVHAPLAISNSGTTDLTYQLVGVAATGSTPAGDALADALALIVTDEIPCTGAVGGTIQMLYQGPLSGARFTGGELAPSSSADLCLSIGLGASATQALSQGTTSVTFTFRGDQA